MLEHLLAEGQVNLGSFLFIYAWCYFAFDSFVGAAVASACVLKLV